MPLAPNTQTAVDPVVPLRPHWLLSLVLDGAIAASAYLASYWLRFQDERLSLFLPAAFSTLPWVVGAQLAALVLAGAYLARPRVDWQLRVFAGIAIGTIAAAAIVGLTFGFAGVSRMAFVADGVLFSVAGLAWRGAWVLSMRRRRGRADSRDDNLVDRATDVTTIGGTVTSLYRYRELLRNLVVKDLKLKYRGSVFGFLWSMVNPLLMIIVYTIAFTYILAIHTEGFVFYLMLGLLAWNFFAGSASMSTGAIIDNSGLVKSVRFPRAILPIATVLFNLAQYLLTLVVFMPVMILWYRVPLSAPMLLFPVFLTLQCLLTIGIASMLATATVFFRDVRHLLEVGLQVLFWTTPIVYQLGQGSEKIRLFVLMSPMSPFVVSYQTIFYHRQWPDPTLWVLATTYGVGAFIVGSALVVAFEDRFAEQI